MRLALLIALCLTSIAAAPKAPKTEDLFHLPADKCEAMVGCDVRPDEKVVQARGITSVFEPSRSGCCSSHQGVCGCTDSRAVCCDGSFSPSCGCD